jgi:DNA modification methylase
MTLETPTPTNNNDDYHLYHSSKHCTIYCGNARDILRRRIKPKSINMAMCSPPYWGLRFYGTEPQIWDADPNCDHDFQARVFLMHSGRGDAQKSAKYSEQERIPDRELSDATCVKCRAWRGELGLEPNFKMFIEHLIQIFDGVWDLLRDDGTLWVNFGDTYSGSGGNNTNCSYSRKGSGGSGEQGDGVYARLKKRASFQARRFDTSGIPGKSLCMIPERFAIVMIERGWILRSKVIWHKPNIMPQSAKDKFTPDWEFVFVFTKSNKTLYWTNDKIGKIVSKQPKGIKGIEGIDWDWAIRERDGTKYKKSNWEGHANFFETQYEPYETEPKQIVQYLKSDYEGDSLKDYLSAGAQDASDTKRRIIANMRARFGGDKAPGYGNRLYSGKPWDPHTKLGRIKRSVWSIPTESYGDEHYAAYPVELCITPVLAGCPEYICNKCGLPRTTIIKETRTDTPPGLDIGNGKSGSSTDPNASLHNSELSIKRQQIIRDEIGMTDCGCNAGWHSGVVLDMFSGTGATGEAALSLGRDFVGIDVNAKFCELSLKRLEKYLGQDRLSSFSDMAPKGKAARPRRGARTFNTKTASS